MEEKATLLESLFERTVSFVKTTVNLYKLKAIDKSADILSTVIHKVLLVVILFFVISMVNVGLALWIGSLLGSAFVGFFLLGLFYFVLALILLLGQNSLVKKPLRNSIIKQLLNQIKE
jgi:hypothetical protein